MANLESFREILVQINETVAFKQLRRQLWENLENITLQPEDLLQLIEMLNICVYQEDKESFAAFIWKIAQDRDIDVFSLFDKLNPEQIANLIEYLVIFQPDVIVENNELAFLVQLLDEKCANIAKVNSLFRKLLLLAIDENNNPASILTQIKPEKISNIKFKDDATLLQICIKANSIKWVKYLLENHKELIQQKNKLQKNALFYLIDSMQDMDDIESEKYVGKMLPLLINAGINIDDKDAEGRSPLMYALLKKNFIVAKALINSNADLTIFDSHEKSAKSYIAKSDNSEVYDLLNDKLKAIEKERNLRPLVFHPADRDAHFVAPQSELEAVRKYLDYLKAHPHLESAKKFKAGDLFKISRIELNEFFGHAPEIKHSYLILPPNANHDLHIGPIMRGSLEEEGVRGLGTSGKILRTGLIINDEEYCVKVLKRDQHSDREYAILSHLGEKLGHKQWYFVRSEAERQSLHKGMHNKKWLSLLANKIEDKSYIVQRYIRDSTLQEMLDNQPEIFANYFYKVQIARAVANALKDLHDANVSHNDLHADNIFVRFNDKTQEFECEIFDFGCAQIIKEEIDDDNFYKIFGVDMRSYHDILRDLNLPVESDLVVPPPLKDYLEHENLSMYQSKELKEILDSFSKKTKPDTQDIHESAVSILDILEKNESKYGNDNAALQFNLQVLVGLPPKLYLACYSMLAKKNPDIITVIERWSQHNEVDKIWATTGQTPKY